MIRLIASGPKDYADLIGADTWRGYAVPQGGLEPEPVLRMLQGWAARLQAAQGWGSWLAVTEPGPEIEGVAEVVASLAIKDVAKDGRVEIGYGTAPARRGRGHATAAVLALVAELADRGLMQVSAQTALANPASGRVMVKAGFRRVGHRLDAEDGTLIVWARDLR